VVVLVVLLVVGAGVFAVLFGLGAVVAVVGLVVLVAGLVGPAGSTLTL
jgi:hypothetical protein